MATTNNDQYFSTTPGLLTNSGLQTLTDLANKYKDNQTLGGLALGGIADAARTQVNTGSSIAYNDAFLSSLGRYQQGLETLKSGNAMQLMAAEGSLQKDLQRDKIASDNYGYDKTFEGVKETAGAARFGYEKQAEASKYTADKGLEGKKVETESEERQIGLTGEEQRKNLGAQTEQQLALRRDARGAIARAGQKFYG